MESSIKIDPIDNIESDLPEVGPWPPIPDAELSKGTTLTPERLIELGAMSGDPGTAKWAFRLIALRDEIMRKAARIGQPVSVRIWKGGLHVNTDAEAAQYHDLRGENSMESMRRQVGLLSRVVDPSRLSGAERAAHDRALCVWGARIAALKRAGKSAEAVAEPAKRIEPS